MRLLGLEQEVQLDGRAMIVLGLDAQEIVARLEHALREQMPAVLTHGAQAAEPFFDRPLGQRTLGDVGLEKCPDGVVTTAVERLEIPGGPAALIGVGQRRNPGGGGDAGQPNGERENESKLHAIPRGVGGWEASSIRT